MTDWAGIEYTTPYAGVTAVGRRPSPGEYVHTRWGRERVATRRPALPPSPEVDLTPVDLPGHGPSRRASRLRGLPARTPGDSSGAFHGCATVYNKVLSDGSGGRELFVNGAFKADDRIEIPVLFMHDWNRHIGWATLIDRPDGPSPGLYFTGQLNRIGKVEIGFHRGLSIAFVPAFNLNLTGSDVLRHYTATAAEVSVVPRGAHHPDSYIELVADDVAVAA